MKSADASRLSVLGIAIFVAMLGVSNIVPFLPLYAKTMGANAFTMGLIFSSFALARMMILGHVGGWSDARGRKNFIVLGLFTMGVTAFIMDWASAPWHLVALRGIMGFASAFILPISLALVADYTTSGREGRTFANFNSAFLLGLGLGPMVGGLIYDHLGISACFYVMSLVTLISCLLVVLRVKDSPPELRKISAQKGLSGQLALLKDRRILGVFLARVGSTLAMGNYLAFLPVLCIMRGMSSTEAGVLLAINSLVMTAVQSPSGRLADRFSRVKLSLAALFVAAVLKALVPLAEGFYGFLFIAVLEGLASGLAMPTLTALAVGEGRRVGAGMGVTMSLFIMGLSVGIFSGPMLGGLAADLININWSFYLTSLACVISLVGMAVFCRPDKSVPRVTPPEEPATPL